MYHEIEAALRQNVIDLTDRARRGELLIIDDLFSGVPPPPPDLSIFCLDGLPERGADTYSPGLSFLWTSAGVDQFATSKRLRETVERFEAKHAHSICLTTVGEVTFLVASAAPEAAAVTAALADCVLALAKHSLNALNKYQDRIDGLSRELMLTVDQAKGRFGLLDLASFLSSATDLEFGLLYLADAPDTPMTRAITVSTTSSPQTLADLADFLNLDRGIFADRPEAPGEPFPAIPLPKNLGAELIVNAGVWGKPLASGTRNSRLMRLLLIPITRPLGPRVANDEQSPLAASDLLFAFAPKLDRALMDELRACVDTFSAHRYGARRFNLLAQLQDGPSVGDVTVGLPNAVRDNPAVLEWLHKLLSEVLYTTSAHSVSVRIYDPRRRALVGAAVTSGTIEGLTPETELPDIAISGNARTSVVVFTFLNAGEYLTHTYLRRISPPLVREFNGRIKTEHRTHIPPQYRELGLQAPLLRRRMTRSEICFPLMKGRLAFGTFNLEAPYPAAFDPDVDYLNLVKTGIEKLYGAADQQVDGRWIITSAARSDAVHQLWQYQEAGTLFSEEQDRILRSIFPARAEHAVVGYHKLSILRGRLQSWIKQRWRDALRDEVLGMVKFDSLNDQTVDAHFLEATFVILRNLTQNAVRHGEPSQDLMMIDDRPWYGVRRTPCLRIHYRSSKSLATPMKDLLGATPIPQDDGRRVAFGMYNVGLLTRLLGGSLHVTERGETGQLTIEIHLPIVEHRT